MNDENGRPARTRHMAAGALAALGAVGAIAAVGATAGTDHPASKPPVRVTSPAPSVPQPLQDGVQQLIDNGSITAAQGHTLDTDIKAGTVHPDQLIAQGFTQAQTGAVQRMLHDTKVQLARRAHGSPSTSTLRRRHSDIQQRSHARHRRS